MEQTTTANVLALQIDTGNTPYLAETAKWAKFLAIMGFIFCGLMIIVGLFAGTIFTAYFNQASSLGTDGGLGTLGAGVFTVIYILIALIYFIPCLYLFNFASKMQAALRTNDQVNLNASFRNLKACFKFWGILLIICLCFYAIILITAIMGSGLGL